MRKKIIIISSISILILSIGLYFYFSEKKDKSIFWKTEKVERGDIGITVTATGSINAFTTVQVGTQVSGTISKLFVDFNSIVKQGQIIALIDTIFLSAAREDAEAMVQKAKVQLKQSQLEFERTNKLFKENTIPQADYDLILTNLETARTNLKSTQAQLNRAKINLQYAIIRAPISGTVISRNMDVGQTVISNFNSPVLFTIANDLTKMQVYANVDEADIGQVKVNQKASFTVDAYPNELFKGEIKQIRLQPSVIQNVVNYTVIIDVPNPELKLMPGLTANINIVITEHKNVLKVPINAFRFVPSPEYFETTTSLTDSTKEYWKNKIAQKNKVVKNKMTEQDTTVYLWITNGNDIYPERVRIGISDESNTEVSGKIKEGDEVVTGINKEESVGTTTKNPFMPKMRPSSRRPT